MTYWPTEVAHRAPVNDFPPAWANAWGDDCYGLWADLMVQGVTQRMRWIEPSFGPGFLMGSTAVERESLENQEVRHWANKTEQNSGFAAVPFGFWLADTPCTQSFWMAVVGGINPSRFSRVGDTRDHPVEQMCLAEPTNGGEHTVEGFLNALNEKLPMPCAALPNEVEWEYACRADTTTPYWWGPQFQIGRMNVNDFGKRQKHDSDGTTPVKLYPPNPWGLYDMLGNVWERTDIDGDMVGGWARGGSWNSLPGEARAASRVWHHKLDCVQYLGFRFALKKCP